MACAQPRLALPRGGPPQRSSRIFVARIPPTVTEELFRQYFEGFGSVQVPPPPPTHPAPPALGTAACALSPAMRSLGAHALLAVLEER